MDREFGGGDTASICDVARALSKLHLTVGIPSSPEHRVFEVCYSYSLTDASTPYLGEYVTQFIRLYRREHPDRVPRPTERWDDRFDAAVQWPNGRNEGMGGWALTYAHQQSPRFKHTDFKEWVRAARHYTDLMCCPGFDVQIDVNVPEVAEKDGEILFPQDGWECQFEKYFDAGGKARVFKKVVPKETKLKKVEGTEMRDKKEKPEKGGFKDNKAKRTQVHKARKRDGE